MALNPGSPTSETNASAPTLPFVMDGLLGDTTVTDRTAQNTQNATSADTLKAAEDEANRQAELNLADIAVTTIINELVALKEEAERSENMDPEDAQKASAALVDAQNIQASIRAARNDKGKSIIKISSINAQLSTLRMVVDEVDDAIDEAHAVSENKESHKLNRAKEIARTNHKPPANTANKRVVHKPFHVAAQAKPVVGANDWGPLSEKYKRDTQEADEIADQDHDDDGVIKQVKHVARKLRDNKPLMDKHDTRNHDQRVSAREVALGSASLGRAVFSAKKWATLGAIRDKATTAIQNNDRRGLSDAALLVGLAVANTTGSDDLGNMANKVISTGMTKTQTVMEGDVGLSNVTSVVGRNALGVLDYVTDSLGINDLANQITPLLGQLMADKQFDFENLINIKRIKQFDLDGNKRLDAQEIITVLRNNKLDFAAVDANHDEKISYQELRAKLAAIAVQNEAFTESRLHKKMDDARDFVLDNAAKLNPRTAALARQIAPILADFQKYARIYDTDKDGKVELHEVIRRMQNQHISILVNKNGKAGIDIDDATKNWDATLPKKTPTPQGHGA